MSEWKTVLLGDICKTNSTSISKNEKWDYVNYLDTGNITANSIDIIQLINLRDDKLPSRAKRKVKYNSIVYSTVRPNQCHYGIIKEYPSNFLVSTGFTVIDVNEKMADADYIYYWLSQNIVTERLHSIAEQSTSAYPSIKPSDLESLELKLPPLEVQKKAASILASLDRKRENNTEINRNLTEQFRAIVDEFILQLEDFELKRLDEIAECQNGHAFYKEGYDEEGAFVIDLGNVNTSANFVYTNADKYISMERYEQDKLEKYRVFKNDLVMVMTDRKSTMELLGKTGKVYKDGYYVLNQRMYRMRAKEGINVNYLYAILNSTKVCNGLKEKALGSVQKYVNTKEINEIEVIVPSPEKMDELAQLVNPISSQMEINILENENLQKLRDELLPKLMSGELDVSDLDN